MSVMTVRFVSGHSIQAHAATDHRMTAARRRRTGGGTYCLNVADAEQAQHQEH